MCEGACVYITRQIEEHLNFVLQGTITYTLEYVCCYTICNFNVRYCKYCVEHDHNSTVQYSSYKMCNNTSYS